MAGDSGRLDVGTGDRHLRRLARPRLDLEPQPDLGVGSAGQAAAVVGRPRAERQLEHDPRPVRRSQRLRLDQRAREQPDRQVHAHRPGGDGHRQVQRDRRQQRHDADGPPVGDLGGCRPTTRCSSPTATATGASSSSTAPPASYLRHWGAYGKRPEDPPQPPPGAPDPGAPPKPPGHGRGRRRRRSSGFRTASSARATGSSTWPIAPTIASRCSGRTASSCASGSSGPQCGAEEKATWVPKRPCGIEAAFSVGLSHDAPQTYLYVADGGTHVITVLRRSDLEVVNEFGGPGVGPGQLGRPHNLTRRSVRQHLRGRGGRAEGEASDDRRRGRRRVPRAEVHVQGNEVAALAALRRPSPCERRWRSPGDARPADVGTNALEALSPLMALGISQGHGGFSAPPPLRRHGVHRAWAPPSRSMATPRKSTTGALTRGTKPRPVRRGRSAACRACGTSAGDSHSQPA